MKHFLCVWLRPHNKEDLKWGCKLIMNKTAKEEVLLVCFYEQQQQHLKKCVLCQGATVKDMTLMLTYKMSLSLYDHSPCIVFAVYDNDYCEVDNSDSCH